MPDISFCGNVRIYAGLFFYTLSGKHSGFKYYNTIWLAKRKTVNFCAWDIEKG